MTESLVIINALSLSFLLYQNNVEAFSYHKDIQLILFFIGLRLVEINDKGKIIMLQQINHNIYCYNKYVTL